MNHVIFATDGDFVEQIAIKQIVEAAGGVSVVGKYTKMETLDATVVFEQSYILNYAKFNELLWAGQLPMKNQESVLVVSECNKQYATLRFLEDGKFAGRPDKYLGCMKRVTEKEAKAQQAWTYKPTTGEWFIVVDNSQSEAPAERDARELWAAIDGVLNGWAEVEDIVDVGGTMGPRVDALLAVRDKKKPRWL